MPQSGRNPEPTAHTVPAGIFRAYDIRGLANTELSANVVEQIGRAIGTEALAQDISSLLCGQDARLSSPVLGAALIRGIRSSGCNVVDLGMVHTPLLYFATYTTGFDSGVMLTASHNPADYNGIKIVLRRSCLADNQIQNLRQRIERQEYSSGQGGYQKLNLRQQYLARICQDIQLTGKPRIVLDCGNAVTATIAPELFASLGCEVIPLFCELDGRFPNHEPDPTQPDNLRDLSKTVLANHADLGIAFDGDGDRLGIVTDAGEIIDTDRLLLLLIEDILPRHPGEKVIYDVKCSTRLPDTIKALGGRPVMHRSGHSFMKQKMQETGAVLGGEFAAHVFIRDRWFGFDDGLYAAARVVEILTRSGLPASRLFSRFGHPPATPELKVPVAEERKFELMQRIIAGADFPDGKIILLDGIRVEFNDGWGLVRASNTSPALLLRFEANSPEALRRIQLRFRELLLQADKSLPICFPEQL
ncbi:MAG: phosphomannomutase/phosphoglucomutase [Pseudohongiellaceae bacterium]